MPRTSEIYAPGTRVFLTEGPPTPGVVLPPPEGADPQFKIVKLDSEEEPVLVRTRYLVAATFTPGRRVFRHTGGPHRFGTISTLGRTPKTLSKRRMDAEEESIVVQWDNGEMDVVVKNHLTPIIYETTE
jgi:hypothetical protein